MYAALTSEYEFRFFATQQLFNSARKVNLAQPLQFQFCLSRDPIHLNRESKGQEIPTYMRIRLP